MWQHSAGHKADLATGATQGFTATVKDTDNQDVAGPALAWSSSDTTTATIDTSGSLTAIAGGITTAAAMSGTISGTAAVAVRPVIANLTPNSGPPGDSVAISGSGFRATQGGGSVTFNGTPATSITSWSATSITAVVPTGATNGNVVVTVGGQASAGVAFTAVPAISGMSPTSAVVGATVTISGAAFGASQGQSSVTIGGVSSAVTSWGNTSIAVTVPGVAPGSRAVVVRVGGVDSNSTSLTVKPNLSGISPTADIIGASVTLSGSNFQATQGSSAVTVGGTSASVSSWSDTSIGVTIPAGLSGTNDVIVTVNGTASAPQPFAVKPNITSLNPSSAVTGAQVTITGTAFGGTQGTSAVAFNGAAASINSWSNTQIVATVPAAALSGNVVVSVGGQASAGAAFSVVPNITSLSTSSALLAGNTVTLYGTGFGNSQGVSTVKFNGTDAGAAISWSNTQISVTMPSGARSGNAVVRVGGNDSNGSAFTAKGQVNVSVS